MKTEKTCRVCGTENSNAANFCNHCGAALPNAATSQGEAKTAPPYDYRFGESDLLESEVDPQQGVYLTGLVFVVFLLTCAGTIAWFILGSPADPVVASPTPTNLPTRAQDVAPVTPTARPTMLLSTVTPAPPTATPTPTEGPCVQQVQADDSLISIVARCGHRDLGIIDAVLELNGLEDASLIQLGQEIQVPRPTPTTDPNAVEETPEVESEDAETTGDTSVVSGLLFAEGAEGLPTPTVTPTATLPPGVMWHVVQRDENIIVLAFQYGADVEILSQLNPEITFSQCDFGEPTGGPNCIVQLFEGQQVRVPAPTPTPTVPPTASGNETATPTPTATFNAPSLVSPGNRVLFERRDLVTLRWAGTGSLGPSQTYRVTVRDLTSGETHTMDTQESFLILPETWQGQNNLRHEYEWDVRVIEIDSPDDPIYVTGTRTFVWETNLETEENSTS